MSWRSWWSTRDSPFATLSRYVSKARDGRVNSREFDDAETAIQKIGSENALLNTENASLRRKLTSLSEQAERDALGMREQGPQAAKDELCARVYTENKRLKAKFESVTSSQGLSHQLLERGAELGVEQRDDPFVAMLGAYLAPNNRLQPNNERHSEGMSPSSSTGASSNDSQPQGVVPPSPRLQRRNSATLCDYDTRLVLERASTEVHSRRRRHYSDVSHEVVYNAGTAAQRRRSLSGSRRCSSASSVPFRRSSRRSSLGLDRFLDVLNDNIDEAASSGHGMSRLSSLVISVLSEARRPAEVTTLRKLLTENTTRSHAEFFLRYTVVNHLVLQLQSPNSARVFGNVCPCLVESSSQFLQKMDTQVPVTKQRYSCPAFSNFGITL